MPLKLPLDLAPEAALRFFRGKGLATSFSWQDLWQQEHEAAFTVAKMMDVDLLTDVRAAVDRALATGQTFEEFREQLEPLLRDAGWWGRGEAVDPTTGEIVEAQLGSPRRLRTIFRVNLQTAYAAGDWEQTVDNAAEAPYLMYDAVDDSRTRAQHRAWDGLVLRYDDPWWDTHRPPNGWNCRCGVVQLSAEEAEQRGLKIAQQAPASPTREFTNKRTGEISRVPDGIDPGWAYNPGKARVAELKRTLDAKRRSYER